jgi:hypothetical protein
VTIIFCLVEVNNMKVNYIFIINYPLKNDSMKIMCFFFVHDVAMNYIIVGCLAFLSFYAIDKGVMFLYLFVRFNFHINFIYVFDDYLFFIYQ